MKASSVITAISGLDSGSTMRRKILRLPAPSTRAASSSSSGTASMNCLARKMPSAVAAEGRMTAQNVP
jgi:hypothetical protein